MYVSLAGLLEQLNPKFKPQLSRDCLTRALPLHAETMLTVLKLVCTLHSTGRSERQ
jgi:hypothetical protein